MRTRATRHGVGKAPGRLQTCIALAAIWAGACSGRTAAPVSPSPAGTTPCEATLGSVPASWITFTFEGHVREVAGLAVAPDARLVGCVLFDPETEGVFVPRDPRFPVESVDSMRYPGVRVELTLGADTLAGNDLSMSEIGIGFVPPFYDIFKVSVSGGFTSGRIAGRAIDHFSMSLLAAPSQWPDSALPRTTAAFRLDLNPGTFCLGYCLGPAGDVVLGSITSIDILTAP